MALIVPLLAIPKQHLSIVLDNQQAEIWVRQLRYGMFMDVAQSGVFIANNVLCENLNVIVRAPYTGFSGDFAFYDTQGTDDPDYTQIGPGGRFLLLYLTAADLAATAAAA